MIIALAAIWLTIVVVVLALAARLSRLEEKIDGMSREVRDELRRGINGVRGNELRSGIGGVRGEIESMRTELGDRIDAVAAELTRTRVAVARLEGFAFGSTRPRHWYESRPPGRRAGTVSPGVSRKR